MKKKQRKVNIRKAFASEFGIEGMLMGSLYKINILAGRKKQLKALKKSKKYKEQVNGLRKSNG